jgi:hypothetical protein
MMDAAVEALQTVLEHLELSGWRRLTALLVDGEPHLSLENGSDRLTDERWLKDHGQEILPYVLQLVDPPDSEVEKLVKVGLIKIGPDLLREPTTLTIRFSCDRWETSAMRISDVAATSTALVALYASLLAANTALGPSLNLDLKMPTTNISAGSIDHTLGGVAALLHGCAILIETLPFVFPAMHLVIPPLAIVASVMLLAEGTILLRPSSHKHQGPKLGDTPSEPSSDRATNGERETKARESLIGSSNSPSESHGPQSDVSEQTEGGVVSRSVAPVAPKKLSVEYLQTAQASSGYLKMQIINMISSKWGLDLPYSVHLLNRTLPTVIGIQWAMPDVEITVNPTA